MKRGEITSIEEIHLLTNNGRDVFIKELGNIPHKTINSPLRKDANPSFSVYCGDNGIWRYKDFSTGDSGSYIDFIKIKYNLSFQDALKYIKNELKVENNAPIRVHKAIEKIKREVKIEFADRPFTKEGHKYWNSFCLSEDFLRKDDIYQVKLYTINDKVIKIPDYQQVFSYYAFDIDRCKLLTIGQNVKNKWISNIDTKYLWFYYLYQEPVEDLFVVKSVKDREVLALLGYKAIALQNESATTFLKHNIQNIEKICKNPIIVMGSDTQGFKTSVEMTKTTGYRWFNTKRYMLKFGVNDPASMCKEFSLEVLNDQIKKDLKKWK